MIIFLLFLSILGVLLSILAMFYAKYCINKFKNFLSVPDAYFDMYDSNWWQDEE